MMRIQTKSIVAAFVLLSLVSGSIGCQSNGTGAWYNPKSYAWHNPFKKGTEAPPYHPNSTTSQGQRPSLGAQPNISVPPGGYANGAPSESEFFTGSSKVVQNQYESSRVAATTYSPSDSMGGTSTYSAATPDAYRPYGITDATPNSYQQTSYQQNFGQPVAANQPMGGHMTQNPAVGTYPGYAAPAEAMPGYGAPAGQMTTPAYGNQGGYGMPATPSYGTGPAQGIIDPNAGYNAPSGYMVNPSNYQPTTAGGF